jgi:hypothetical protein
MLLYRPKSPSSGASTGAGSTTKNGGGGSPKTLGDEMSMATGTTSNKDRSPVKARIETQLRSPDAHPIDGRVPTEASFNVMKMVIGAAGAEAKTSGKSTSGQLRSLRTEPSLKLLKTTSWRDFFDAEDIGGDTNTKHSNNARSPSPSSQSQGDRKGGGIPLRSESPAPNTTSLALSRPSNSFAPYAFTSGFSSTSRTESESDGSSLMHIYQNLVQRIEFLWGELKIPSGDIKFYKETLCSGKPRGLDHCRELARYIKTLEEHRLSVLRVLQTIEVREILVAHFHEILLALNRKYVYRRSYETQSGDKAVKGMSFDSNLAWKEEIVEVLKELQVQTVEVIQAIQHWRKGLWRPHAFVWKGHDYIAKMRDDLSVLGTEVYMRQLESIPIYRHELLCLLFQDVEDGADTFRDARASESWQFKTEMSSTVVMAHSQLREYFLSGDFSKDELDMAARVVYEDGKLQKAIRTEKEALLSKRVFIPTLKVDIIKEAEPRRVNPFYNKYHAHVKRPTSAQATNGATLEPGSRQNRPVSANGNR